MNIFPIFFAACCLIAGCSKDLETAGPAVNRVASFVQFNSTEGPYQYINRNAYGSLTYGVDYIYTLNINGQSDNTSFCITLNTNALEATCYVIDNNAFLNIGNSIDLLTGYKMDHSPYYYQGTVTWTDSLQRQYRGGKILLLLSKLVGNNLLGFFSGTLKNDSGATLPIASGIFNVKVNHL